MPDEKPTSKSDSFIQKKIGPFPLWGWAAIGGAAIGVLFIVRRQQAGATGTYTPGQTATAGGLGVTSTDPLTISELTAQLAQLNSNLVSASSPVSGGGNTPLNRADWFFTGDSWRYAPGGDSSQSFNLGGYQYTLLPNAAAASAAAAAGQQIFFFPEPGANPIAGAVPGVTGSGYVRTLLSSIGAQSIVSGTAGSGTSTSMITAPGGPAFQFVPGIPVGGVPAVSPVPVPARPLSG